MDSGITLFTLARYCAECCGASRTKATGSADNVEFPTDPAITGNPPPVPLSLIGEMEWLASESTMYQTEETTAMAIHSTYFGLTILPPDQSLSDQIREHPETIDRSFLPTTVSKSPSTGFTSPSNNALTAFGN